MEMFVTLIAIKWCAELINRIQDQKEAVCALNPSENIEVFEVAKPHQNGEKLKTFHKAKLRF